MGSSESSAFLHNEENTECMANWMFGGGKKDLKNATLDSLLKKINI